MQEATYLILTALAAGSRRGYGIIGDVAQISGDRVRLRAGTLYTALDRLKQDGLVAVDREEIAEGRLRRYYRLTPDGQTRLAAEADRLQANATAALRRLRPDPPAAWPDASGRRSMNEFPQLERRYRRLLACYPRAFRRENSEEILAVLLACAQDGQRRPGFAASADLIRGAVRMRLRLAGQPPRTVQVAIRLMYAGLAVQVATLITLIVTADQVRRAVAHRYPGAGAAAAQHLVNVHLLIDYVSVAAGIAVWLALTWALVHGRDRARFTVAADLGAMSLGLLSGIARDH